MALPSAKHWRARAATLEAMAWLGLARLLVARVSLARWRAALGRRLDPQANHPAVPDADNRTARQLARAVERAAARLPGESLCLPQAMALQWLLRRRGIDAVLHIGIRAGQDRGGIDDLHAWVERGGEILIGDSDVRYLSLYAAGPAGQVRRAG